MSTKTICKVYFLTFFSISPGFGRIRAMIEDQSTDPAVRQKIKDDVATFGNFAYYPTGTSSPIVRSVWTLIFA